MLQKVEDCTEFPQDDLLVFPTPSSVLNLTQDTVITIGDLHANSLLLIYFLLKNGIISLNPMQYHKICTLHQEIGLLQRYDRELFHDELREKYCLFLELIDGILVRKTTVTIRFLGDELADRGECDLFILKILQKLHANEVKFKILMSNHGIAFLSSLHYLIINKTEQYSEMMLKPNVMPSLVCLRKLLWNGIIQISELERLVNEVYLPNLELLDYGICDKNEEIYIYTHAAMNNEQLEMLASEYGIYWQDANLAELANTLEKLKQKFKSEKLEALNVLFHNLARSNDSSQKLSMIKNQLTQTVFWNHLLYSRQYSTLRPFLNNNYRVCNVHGHDRSHVELNPQNPYYLCLDSELGKYFHVTKGENKVIRRCETNYEVYISKKTPTLWSFFKPYFPTVNQSILLSSIGIGFIFYQKYHLSIIIPFLRNFYENFIQKHTKKLLKY